MHHRVVFVAQPQVQREMGREFQFVLCVARGQGVTAAGDALSLQIGGGVGHVVNEVVVGGVADG